MDWPPPQFQLRFENSSVLLGFDPATISPILARVIETRIREWFSGYEATDATKHSMDLFVRQFVQAGIQRGDILPGWENKWTLL